MDTYDVIVIGAGAAGLSAALVLTRARRRVLVVDSGAPRNAPARHMHGFLSRDGLPPSELSAIGRAEIAGYGGEIVPGSVVELVACDASGFRARLGDGPRVAARRVLVATGLRDEIPTVPGLSDRWGRDVLHCPYCHGYEVRDRRLGVLGWAPGSARYAQLVRQWSRDVVMVAPAGSLTTVERAQLLARSIEVVEGEPVGVVVRSDRLIGIRLADGTVITLDALFVPPRFRPHHDLLLQLGVAVDESGWTVVDSTGRTSVPGLWAAGNVVNPRAQVITAAGDGSASAIDINADLVEEDVRIATREAAHGLLV
ncbi:NAD(P)/FAD-dependent oxidoreductase [Nakamurella sp.]|uniref:NAD(P)/FAD-dependent oxidoreductase n=1 Tax=Nakamurella sp. TaxID=1869182 RepID=UPI003783E474